MASISGEQGNKVQNFRGTEEQRHKKTNFQFWGTGEIPNKPIYFSKQGNWYPPPSLGGPQQWPETCIIRTKILYYDYQDGKCILQITGTHVEHMVLKLKALSQKVKSYLYLNKYYLHSPKYL